MSPRADTWRETSWTLLLERINQRHYEATRNSAQLEVEATLTAAADSAAAAVKGYGGRMDQVAAASTSLSVRREASRRRIEGVRLTGRPFVPAAHLRRGDLASAQRRRVGGPLGATPQDCGSSDPPIG